MIFGQFQAGCSILKFVSSFIPSTDWSLDIVDLCEEFRNRNVVGLDIAGDESMGEIPAMKEHIMAFQVT